MIQTCEYSDYISIICVLSVAADATVSANVVLDAEKYPIMFYTCNLSMFKIKKR